MFIFAIAARLLLLSGGIFAPAFRSFQLLQKGPGNEAELTAQLKHFITIACFMCAEYVADWLFFLFPLYDELKFAVVAWLCHPQLRGSIVLYDALLEQQLVQREAQIDALLVQASGNLASALFTVVGWLSSQIPKLFSLVVASPAAAAAVSQVAEIGSHASPIIAPPSVPGPGGQSPTTPHGNAVVSTTTVETTTAFWSRASASVLSYAISVATTPPTAPTARPIPLSPNPNQRGSDALSSGSSSWSAGSGSGSSSSDESESAGLLLRSTLTATAAASEAPRRPSLSSPVEAVLNRRRSKMTMNPTPPPSNTGR